MFPCPLIHSCNLLIHSCNLIRVTCFLFVATRGKKAVLNGNVSPFNCMVINTGRRYLRSL